MCIVFLLPSSAANDLVVAIIRDIKSFRLEIFLASLKAISEYRLVFDALLSVSIVQLFKPSTPSSSVCRIHFYCTVKINGSLNWSKLYTKISLTLDVASRKVIWLFPEQLRVQFVPFLHGLQGCLAAQG